MEYVTTGVLELLLEISPPLPPQRIQLVTVGEEEKSFNIAPPVFEAIFPEKLQLVRMGEALSLFIPPPKVALFFEKLQLVSVGEEASIYTPPPSTSGNAPPLALPPFMVKPSKIAVLFIPLLLRTKIGRAHV